jgi:hypothetical protein
MSVTGVTIAGSAVNLAAVDYSINVYHGRDSIENTPESSSAELLIYVDGQASIPYKISDTVVISSWSTTRFTGNITDITVEHLYSLTGTPVTAVSIIAMGNLRELGRYVDAGSFSAQSLQNRVDAILTGTGLTYTAEADPELDLTAYAPGPTVVRDLLDELCEWTGATVYDTPDGRIWFESYTRRGYDYSTATWSDMGTTTWAGTVGLWSEQYGATSAAPTPVVLPSAAVVWSPTWTANLETIVNDVTVTYGTADPQASVTVTDSASIAIHGPNEVRLETGLADLTAATRRAQGILTAQGDQRYQIGKVEVLLELLTAGQRTSVLGLKAGARVIVQELPQPAPFSEFLGVVEGWGELHQPDRVSLTLALSDPRYSYAVVSWGQAPATATWGGVPVSKKWSDIIQPTDLD